MTTSILISGATGFVAQHIIKLLLSKKYKVVGTVRSSQKGQHLKDLYESKNFGYEIVPSLAADDAFDEVLQKHPEVTVSIHTASPVDLSTTDNEKDLLVPAVNGIESAFHGIKKYGPQIRHVVLTSSVAAMADSDRFQDPTLVVDENSWNSISWDEAKTDNAFVGYMASKKFAEQAAMDFVIEEKPNFGLTVVCPVYVLGPQAFDSEIKDVLNFSAEVINASLKLKPDSEIPYTKGAFVDVWDVAKAHLIAFGRSLANERLLLSSGNFTSSSILEIITNEFEPLRSESPKPKPGTADAVNFC